MKLPTDEAFRKYGDSVFRAAFSICRDRADADDVTQNTFVKYHCQQREFAGEDHVRAWLLRVAINQAKDLAACFWRRNRTPWQDYLASLPPAPPEEGRLLEAVLSLPQRYRAVLHLFYYEDYSIREIGQTLGLGESAVKSRLSRGRRLLKNMLQEDWDDDE